MAAQISIRVEGQEVTETSWGWDQLRNLLPKTQVSEKMVLAFRVKGSGSEPLWRPGLSVRRSNQSCCVAKIPAARAQNWEEAAPKRLGGSPSASAAWGLRLSTMYSRFLNFWACGACILLYIPCAYMCTLGDYGTRVHAWVCTHFYMGGYGNVCPCVWMWR